MFVYKKLKASDASITAFEAHKEFNVNKDNTASLGVSLINSQYSSGSKDSYSQFNYNNELQYFQLDHLFYNNSHFNIGNLNGGINYINQEKRLYDKASILSISQKNFGSSIQKGTVNFNSIYVDDSKGNLYNNNDTISSYPNDNERVFYLGPVNGFKRRNLNRDLRTGILLVNPPTSYNSKSLDDSLYINPIEYISCSIEDVSDLNCTGVQLENGYIKVPHNNNYNFGSDEFSITFYYKALDVSSTKYLISKGGTQTMVKTPGYNTNGGIKGVKPPEFDTSNFYSLQASEEDAGKAFPFEVILNAGKVYFSRADQDVITTLTSSAALSNNTLHHIACIKEDNNIKIYIDGVLRGSKTDNTNLCKNQADLFIGANSSIDNIKLDSTSEGVVSQLMVWNKGLTNSELGKVSSSIDGTPYIGNVFYENGIITFTSPKINEGDFTTNTEYNIPIDLNPTSYNVIGGSNVDERDLTFSGSAFTFFNQETIFDFNETNIESSLNYNTNIVSVSNTKSNPINLYSIPNILVDTYNINPIYEETTPVNLTTYAQLNNVIEAIPGGVGTGSGDLGTDGDSFASITNNSTTGLILKLTENQTVTASFDINPVDATLEQDEHWTRAVAPGQYTPISPTELESETVYNFGGDNEGGVIKAGRLNSSTTFPSGALLVTGSNGFVSIFHVNSGANSLPRIGVNQSGVVTDNLNTTKYIYFSSSTAAASTFGSPILEGDNPLNITNGYYPSNGSIYNFTDAVNVDSTNHSKKFLFGPAIEDGKSFSKLYKSPGSITFKAQIRAYTGTNEESATAQFQYKKNNGSWVDMGSIININDNSTLYTRTVNLSSLQSLDKIQFRIKLDKTTGGFVSLNVVGGDVKVWIDNQGTSARFNDRIHLRSDLFSVAQGDIIQYYFNDINGYNNQTFTTYPNNLELIRGWSTLGGDNNGIISVSSNTDNNLDDLSLWIKLVNSNTGNIVSSHNINSSGYNDINNTLTVGNGYDISAGNYHFDIYLGNSDGNISYHDPFTGFYLEHFQLKKWAATNTYGYTGFVGPGGTTYTEFGTDSNNDILTLSQNINFNDDTAILTGSPPGNASSMSDTQIIFPINILITSSLGATASFDQGNYVSGSASIDITGTEGIYKVDKMTLNTTPVGGLFQNIGAGKKIRVQTKLNGSIIDTKYIDDAAGQLNLFQAEIDKINLGTLSNTDNVSFEYAIVNDSNNLDVVFENKGFEIQDIAFTKITSSNQVTTVDGENFDTTLTELTFSSSHDDIGDASFPFNIGAITASVSSISEDTITLNNNYLITESFDLISTGYSTIPRIMSASFDWDYEIGKEYGFAFNGTTQGYNDANNAGTFGPAIRLLDANNNIITEAYGGGSTFDIFSATSPHHRFTSTGTGKLLFFISGASSPLYPDGIITGSGTNATASFGTSGLTFSAIAKSGSYTSSGVTITQAEFDEGYSNSDKFHLTSSHTTAGTVGPILTTGQNTYNIQSLTAEGNIRLTTPLFITASSQATGSHITQSFVDAVITAIPANPLNTDSDTNANMVGGTFIYTDPTDSSTETVTITDLINNPDGTTDIELNNGNGTFQVGTYTSQLPQEVTVNYNITTTNDYTLQFKNTHLIFENEFHCTVEEDEFNFTLNPTVRKNKSINSGDLSNFATGSNFKPYVTTIGLYNEEGELLVVGKLAQPIRMSDETDTTFVVRFDT